MSAQRPLFDPDRMAAAKSPPASRPKLDAAGSSPSTPQVMTVSHLSRLIKQILGDHLPGTIHLVGQISNCSRHSSGHLYLTLKDDRSEIRAVMWRSAMAGLKFQPADGMEVVATGHVDLYENRGQYQFYINRLEPRGIGALELAFRQLREKLQREGLFEPARKKPIPRFPRRIAVVTSPTGAAIRDILRTLGAAMPLRRRARASGPRPGRRRGGRGRGGHPADQCAAGGSWRYRHTDRRPRGRIARRPLGVQRGGGGAGHLREPRSRSSPAWGTRWT